MLQPAILYAKRKTKMLEAWNLDSCAALQPPQLLYLWDSTGDLYHLGPSRHPVLSLTSECLFCILWMLQPGSISHSIPFKLMLASEASYTTTGDKLMSLTNSLLKTLETPSTHSLIDKLKWVLCRSHSGWYTGTNLSWSFNITMRSFYKLIALSLLAAGTMVVGLVCNSECSACWKNGSPGVDIKMTCDTSDWYCGTCSAGHSGHHCAKQKCCI